MRDRLIELISQVQYMGGLEGKLADHLLAAGVIAPPCKVGDVVYHITNCGEFHHELDGSLYDGLGGFGDATGYYCPCELRDNCPSDNEEEFDCDKLKAKQAVFEDEVKGFVLGEREWDNVVFLGYSGNVYFNDFGKIVFTSREEAERALAERREG